MKDDKIVFCDKREGRIAVFAKSINTLLDFETMPRIGTIKYYPVYEEHLFFQGFFGGGTKIDADDMRQIVDEMERLNLMKRR